MYSTIGNDTAEFEIQRSHLQNLLLDEILSEDDIPIVGFIVNCQRLKTPQSER